MDANIKRRTAAQKRRWRVRKKVVGSAERPRLTVFRSHLNIYAQIINDDTGVTIVSASTRDKDLRDQVPNKKGTNKAAAAFIGTKLAEKAKAKGVTKVCFDRGPYKYHGRIAALADAARKAGLDF